MFKPLSLALLGAAAVVAVGATGTAAGEYPDRLIFGSVSNYTLGHRELDSNDEGNGQTLELAGASALNIPIWKGFALQLDSMSEYYFGLNDSADVKRTNALGMHLSYRDPGKGLIGVFGGYAWSKIRDGHGPDEYDMALVGAEAQAYLGNLTLYAQAGVGNQTKGDNAVGFNDGWFVRGVARYFLAPNTKLEAEISYAEADPYADGGLTGKFTGWGVSIDHKLFNVMNFPVYGTVAYRGAEYDVGSQSATEQVFKAGIKVLWGAADLKHNDRYGATLDLPTLPMRANAMAENLN